MAGGPQTYTTSGSVVGTDGSPHGGSRVTPFAAWVRVAIEALNYRPNLSARHLHKTRVGVLALAIPDLANTYFSDIGNTVGAAAAAHAYTVLLDHTGGDRGNEILVANALHPHLIDGVILSALALTVEGLRPTHLGVPNVLLGEQLFSAPRPPTVPLS